MRPLRKILANGGPTKNTQALTGNVVGGLGVLTSFVDALDAPNQYGRQSTGTSVVKGVASGASAGASFGPWGAAIGGVVGGIGGLVSGIRAKREEATQKRTEASLARSYQLAQYSARAAANPNIESGTRGEEYFATGGKLKTEFMNYKAKGGHLSKLSSDTVEVKGNTHKEGGVKIPGAEVEKGETIKGDYVLSHRLGFAQLHKPIAKAIGQIEQKPINPTSMKSLERLREQEKSLILMQEFVKHKNNLQ